MPSLFKRIGIMGRTHKAGVKETLSGLCHYLREQQQPFLIEYETGMSVDAEAALLCKTEEFAERIDLLIVIGGDGSLLNAIQAIAETDIAVIGINRGKVGFLTDIRPAELSKLGAILRGEYLLEDRFLLHADIQQQHKTISEHVSLNEIALVPDASTQINDFEIYIDQRFVCSLSADGLIIATPTGSTAYALSGGGPILHPNLSAIVLVPMFAHTLTMRPIVISADANVHIHLPASAKTSLKLAFDGHHALSIPYETDIHIKKWPSKLHLIHPLDYDYYETLRNKLHWGQKLPTSF